LNERQQLRWTESFLESFRPGQKGGAEVGKTKQGKDTKSTGVADGHRIPSGDHLCSAETSVKGRSSKVRIAETTLLSIRAGPRHHPGRPRRKRLPVIADKAYDSDDSCVLRARPGILLNLAAPKESPPPAPQARRILRRYKQRWTIKRTFAWLGNPRRLLVRYDGPFATCRASPAATLSP
jgi:hypothetical protein